jgi:hypothetical protein
MQQLRFRAGVHRGFKIWAEAGYVGGVLRPGDQRVAILVVQPRQRPRKIADVGADAEILYVANVDRDMQSRPPPAATGPSRPRASRRTAGNVR